jgi:hypothetical protein
VDHGADSFDSLSEWRARLEHAEDTLAEREQQARDSDDHAELGAVAVARASLSAEWDVLADRHDAWAQQRDLTGLRRDKRASDRDVATRRYADDADPGFPNRWHSAGDRDDSSGDRSDSFDDRQHSAEARDRAATDRDRAAGDLDAAAEQAVLQEGEIRHLEGVITARNVIGQAMGLVMARKGLSSDEAFAHLSRLSQDSNTRLRDVAAGMVADAQPDSA